MLLLRHTDVLSAAIAFSGYFTAAIRNSETKNAYLAWSAVRDQLGEVLQTLAAREVATGVLR